MDLGQSATEGVGTSSAHNTYGRLSARRTAAVTEASEPHCKPRRAAGSAKTPALSRIIGKVAHPVAGISLHYALSAAAIARNVLQSGRPGEIMTEIDSHDFERAKVCYEQNFEHARSLNVQMNHIPTIAITATGGLWFAAGASPKMELVMRFGLLMFAGICDIGLVLAILRVRDVFHSYLEKIREFNPPSYADGRPEKPKIVRLGAYSMVTVYASLMLIASLLSLAGALTFYWPFEVGTRAVGVIIVIGVVTTLFSSLYTSRGRTFAVPLVFAAIAWLAYHFRGY